MTVFVALLRAINVGGSGKLPMKELVALCAKLGFDDARTYIQSGNVIFKSGKSETAVRGALAKALHKTMGKPVDLAVRTSPELRAVLRRNPFPEKEAAKTLLAFLASPVPKSALRDGIAPGGEEVRAGKRVLYIHYPHGQGRSKLKLRKALGPLTMRNINTVSKLVAMMEE